MLNSKKYLIWVLVLMLFLTSCFHLNEITGVTMYSRDDVHIITSSNSFGKGRVDDIYTALLYVYSDKNIKEKFGTEFEINPENIICHISEGESFLFYWLYRGNAEYEFILDEYIFNIKLSKTYFGDWKVDECSVYVA